MAFVRITDLNHRVVLINTENISHVCAVRSVDDEHSTLYMNEGACINSIHPINEAEYRICKAIESRSTLINKDQISKDIQTIINNLNYVMNALGEHDLQDELHGLDNQLCQLLEELRK